MYALRLTCEPEQVDLLSGDLWELGTEGIQEISDSEHQVTLLARFSTNERRREILDRFAGFSSSWRQEPDTDWLQFAYAAWPGRMVGEKLFLATPWLADPTPPTRHRLIHNPGLACGTGEHPCTQLALLALERTVVPGSRVADVGTGSGILAIAALRLGASVAVGLDTDGAALRAARENFLLNSLEVNLVEGSIDCFVYESVDLVVANINASVLLSIADELALVLKEGGHLILTGFPIAECPIVEQAFSVTAKLEHEGWSCLIAQTFSGA